MKYSLTTLLIVSALICVWTQVAVQNLPPTMEPSTQALIEHMNTCPVCKAERDRREEKDSYPMIMVQTCEELHSLWQDATVRGQWVFTGDTIDYETGAWYAPSDRNWKKR